MLHGSTINHFRFFVFSLGTLQRVPETLVFSEAPVSIPLQPVICPTNRDLIACVANSELTVGHVPSNTWVQLTHVANESKFTLRACFILVSLPLFVLLDAHVGPVDRITNLVRRAVHIYMFHRL